MSVQIYDSDIHPQLDVSLSGGRMVVGPTTPPDVFERWVEHLRRDPERDVPTDSGSITAKLLLERYIDIPDGVQQLTDGDVLRALHRYGWIQ